MRPIRTLACAALLAAGLCGCEVGPAYHKPAPKTPAAFGELGSGAPAAGKPSAAPADPATLSRWWTVFGDPELDSLISRALANNRDLKAAVSRVREARAERAVAAGAFLPEVAATAGYNRSRGSKNVNLPLGSLAGASAPSGSGGSKAPASAGGAGRAADAPEGASTAPAQSVPPGGPASPFGEGGLPGVTTSLYQAGFDAVWEADVFGGTRRAVEAADAQAAAAREGEYGVRVTLMAEVATAYLQVRAIQEREMVARRSIESQRKTWRIADDTFRQGLGSEAEAARELAQLRAAEAALAPMAAAERMAGHALAFMLGEDPTALAAELATPKPLPDLPPEVPVGIPSDLLLRRPDVRGAERTLAAASAEVGVATAELYPQFSITGTLGVDSSQLKQLPRWSSGYFSVAPGVSWPILDWSRIHAGIRVQDERQAQALLAYETAVSQALKDVEDALVQFNYERDHRAGLAAAVAQARRAREVTAQIYAQGLADQTETLVAERAVSEAEDGLAQSDAALRVDLVSLYKALGGGWQEP